MARVLLTVALLIFLAWLWAFDVAAALQATSGRQPVLGPNQQLLAERLGMVGLYGDIFPPWARGAFLNLALGMEQRPAARSILLERSQASADVTSLTSGYALAHSYQVSGDQGTLYRLRSQAYSGMQRLGQCFCVLFATLVGATYLAFHSRESKSAPLPSGTERAYWALGLFWLWHVINQDLVRPGARLLAAEGGVWAATFAAQLGGYLALALLLRVGANRQWRPFGPVNHRLLGKAYWLCLLVLPACDLMLEMLTGVKAFGQNPTLALFATAPLPWLFPLLGILLVAGPLFEELLFRGWLLGGLRSDMGDRWALVVSSLLFTLAHGSFWNVPSHFLGGMILGWVALRTGSISTSLALHALWNLSWLCWAFAYLP